MIEIIGKNGAGKSYLANKLYDFGFERKVGYTTRPIRDGEINGIDYYFISKEQFEELIRSNQFIDYKIRNGFYYGISRNKINNNTILVSGDSKKIENIIGTKIIKIYIDCDFLIRYARVLERNEDIMNIFNRFHTENFSYLYDFNAIFINNNLENNNSFNEMVSNINNSRINNLLVSNKTFIEQEVQRFNLSDTNNNDNKLLVLLRYEEYLLRKLFLENKNLCDLQVVERYYRDMKYFMSFNKIRYFVMNDELYADIDNNEYKFDYKIKRKVK